VMHAAQLNSEPELMFVDVAASFFPLIIGPAASHRANPRGTHWDPSTTQGIQPGSSPLHRQCPLSAINLYNRPKPGRR